MPKLAGQTYSMSILFLVMLPVKLSSLYLLPLIPTLNKVLTQN